MVAYVDSSVVLRYILTGEIVMKHVAEFPRVVSSELLELLAEINAADVSVFSHDHTLNLCARALGFRAVLLRA